MSEPPLRYRAPQGVKPIWMRGELTLSTSRGGKVWIDRKTFQIWEAAQNRTLDEMIAQSCPGQANEDQIRAALACLAEANLLEREGFQQPAAQNSADQNQPVSIVMVTYNSLGWLEECFQSIIEQSHPALEIILVDNASGDRSADWVEEHYPQARVIRLHETVSFAQALNLGIKSARGDLYLLLNPDTKLEKNAVSELVHKVIQSNETDPPCAAVAAKLRLLWAPGFLNGLGNLVGAISWGTDIGLGHLDLGQFDAWKVVPSACFAAALISAQAFEVIGPLDEGFPMYYEDSEWCYRARLMGFSIMAAPNALVYHAFSSPDPAGWETQLSPIKLRRVTYGRLRFITRINDTPYLQRFRLTYRIEDILRGITYLLRGKIDFAHALYLGWQDFRGAKEDIQLKRAALQARRKQTDKALYQLQRGLPAPLFHKNLPILTWDVICNIYLPLMRANLCRPLPELDGWRSEQNQDSPASSPSSIRRSIEIGRNEGFRNLLARYLRQIQWRLMQP